jgi:hypothetical protein
MIIRRDFLHAGIMYSFNWNRSNHEEFTNDNTAARLLYKYLARISKSEVPSELFNDTRLWRISRFKISGVPRGFCPSIGRELIAKGKITRLGPDNDFSRVVRNVFRNFRASGIEGKPGHDPVLKHLLINNKNSIATEIPVWRPPPNPCTGHIDLLQISEAGPIVVDYKPEGNFMRSLPQVAFYGFLLGRNLNLPNITCISFNDKDAWQYEPAILAEEVNPCLEKFKQAPIPWANFINN